MYVKEFYVFNKERVKMKKSFKNINGYVIMIFIGIIVMFLISHISHSEYVIGLFHGAGMFMLLYGAFANFILAIKSKTSKSITE